MTDVALKDYLERLIHETDRRYADKFAALALALTKAENGLNEYKIINNEWRGALKDLSGLMATRAELEKLAIDVRELQRARANLDGRLVVLSGSVSVLVTIALWMFMQFGQR